MKMGGEQTFQQGIALRHAAQSSGALQQAMGIGGIGHGVDATEIDAQTDSGGSLLHLRLAHAHGFGVAQALTIELDKRHALGRQVRQQLHAMPRQLDFDIRVAAAQLSERVVELTLADQAPGANKIKERIDTQSRGHGATSIAALGGV
ncbi:hypothetical protein D3C76_888370 [compost metagenome]